MTLPFEERFVIADDGTRIAYHVLGEGPPILLCNGLGGSWRAWTHQIRELSDRYRFISWDYRGLYRSETPPNPNALTVADQAGDGLAILDAEGIEDALLFGWSMGVQVALEIFRKRAAAARGFVLMNGVAGRPWESVLNVRQMSCVLPTALSMIEKAPWASEIFTRRLLQWPGAVKVVKKTGVTAPSLDEEIFRDLTSGFADLDMEIYMRTLRLLGEHDAHDVLADIEVPTLVVTGTRDIMTPEGPARRLARSVREAELFVVKGGTHYLAVEFPQLVADRIDRFLDERL